ncbi:PAS domain-containing sensor histidine kinase [Dechloromonas sp. H13]|uniref:sensor histidine kinase n=1 Tax=Dechloromonas sp. H13 TaxID=2570193 RepID=UPI001291BE21|nr:PAS domain-containing sensor histidine kinase [Dechloromonas sp. H13]
MSDWLATTWEASWRPFQYFNLYRLVLGGLALLGVLLPEGWIASLHLTYSLPFLLLAVLYMSVVGTGLLASIHWQHRFNFQLSLQVMTDVAAIGLLMYAGGGIGSGVGALMLVSLATASLVGRGRLVLFYAALATLATLGGQVVGAVFRDFEPATIVQAGFLSAGFFATAILARLLGQRLMANEELARQRGISLENQSRISQRVIERMQDGILVVDSDGQVQRHNPVVETMLGAAPAPEMRLADYCPALAAALAGWKVARANATTDFQAPNGSELRARFEQTASSAGEILVFLEDIGRIEERAQQMKLAALGRLTASIAHEIRNPLSAISHAGELLREERRGDMQERLLKILADNVARLDRIVADILELGRRDRMQAEYLPLRRFCAQFVESFESAHAVVPGLIQVDVAGDPGICFDRTHLDQVLWNLLGNAVRHCRGRPGSVRLHVAAGDGQGLVELHVIDDGAGVPEMVRSQIFEPFFTTHHLGTGLGLFIARELCEANGASLELAADADGGHFILVGRCDTCLLPEASDARAAN